VLLPGWGAIVSFSLGWLAGWLVLWRARPLPPAPSPRAVPVSVVVPARDEEVSLPALLASLGVERRADDDVVVVDDHSTDATASIAAVAGATVVAAPPLPAGWAGKPHACHVGVQHARHDIVVFVDADVRLAPGTLDAVVAQVLEHPDELVSVQPYHRTDAAHEQASLLFNIAALMGSGAFTPLGERVATHVAFGPLVACTRTAYERAGGHAHPAVRQAVLEDIALAQRFPRSRLFAGTASGTSFRMYPRDLRQVIEGWTKGFGIGFDATPWWALVATAGWITSLAGGVVTSPWFALASLVQLAVLARRVGRFRWWAVVVSPVWCALVVVVLARSLWARRRGGRVTWKGRELRPDQAVGAPAAAADPPDPPDGTNTCSR
jgi:4,4'-diaponeurosporenoate glycosyltransferase